MPFPGRDEDEAARSDRKTAGIVLHFAGARFDQIEMLRCDGAGRRGAVDVPWRMRVRRVRHAAELQVPGSGQAGFLVDPESPLPESLLVNQRSELCFFKEVASR